MAFKHEWGVELCNKRQNCVHVLNTFIESLECSVVLDIFILRLSGVALLGLHVFNQGGKQISVNLVPQCVTPGLKLHVYKGNQVPHLL